jgi:hypothetical protein
MVTTLSLAPADVDMVWKSPARFTWVAGSGTQAGQGRGAGPKGKRIPLAGLCGVSIFSYDNTRRRVWRLSIAIIWGANGTCRNGFGGESFVGDNVLGQAGTKVSRNRAFQ